MVLAEIVRAPGKPGGDGGGCSFRAGMGRRLILSLKHLLTVNLLQ
jgi:hypothetical protein